MLTRVPLRAVLFDWDGTLLDSYRADASAYLQMFRAMGIPWGMAELKRHYSPDWYRVYRAAKLPSQPWPEADRLWRHVYKTERSVLQPRAERGGALVQQVSSRARYRRQPRAGSRTTSRFRPAKAFPCSGIRRPSAKKEAASDADPNRDQAPWCRTCGLRLYRGRTRRRADGAPRRCRRGRHHRTIASAGAPSRISARSSDREPSGTAKIASAGVAQGAAAPLLGAPTQPSLALPRASCTGPIE